MAEQQTIDQLVGLAVAMLGVAPGTDWLNARAKQIDAGATVDDIANEIQSSTGFEARYPAFRSDERFARDFLEALLGDNVTDAIMMAAQDHVTGRLKAGETRGEVAAFLVEAMTVIAADEESPFYADFGKAATAFHNKVMVAKHYTEEALKASPDDKVLEGVTDDPATVETAINNIDNPQVEQPSMEGVTRTLTGVRENIKGTDFDDIFIAEPALNPVTGASVAPLQSSDILDGGDGVDTLEVYSSGRLSIQTRQVKNIERVVLNADTSINADMSSWEGLESVNVTHFDGDVTIEVDGASVSVKDGRTFNGDATIVGAGGAVDINAGEESAVHVGSGDHTESVMVKGGASVLVDNGPDGKQSKTVTKVVVDGVRDDGGTPRDPVADGKFQPMVDDDGFVVAADGTDRVELSADGTYTRLTLASDGVTLQNGGASVTSTDSGDTIASGAPITIQFTYTDPDNAGNTSAIKAQLKFDIDNGGIVLGEVIESGTPGVLALPAAKTMYEGKAIPSGEVVVPDPSIGKEASGNTVPDPRGPEGGGPTLRVNSDAIETIQLHNTKAIAVVKDDSEKKDDDDKDIPDRAPLGVAVEDFDGELRLEGEAVSDDVTFTVVKASDFDLVASTKMVTVEGDAKLTLDIHGPAGKPSTTLETIKVSGEGGVTMAGLSGMDKLKMIDASGSSGANHFKSQAGDDPADKDELKALAMVKGGSGKDTVTLRTSDKGKLEHIDTGDGADMVTITGAAFRKDGLTVNLGEKDDTFSSTSVGNAKSGIDGGAGRDTLHLTTSDGAIHGKGDAAKSIYSGFEVLDVGDGTGEYDVKLLGIDTEEDVLATGGTGGSSRSSGVTLKNMAVKMGITVHGKEGTATNAYITHDLLDEVRGRPILDVNLRATGGDKDTKSSTTGEVTLELEADRKVDALEVTSSASVGGSGTMAPKAADYSNTLMLEGAAGVRDITVDGDASLTIRGPALAGVRLVEASKSGGVDFIAAAVPTVQLYGGAGKDTLNALAVTGAYEIEGGAGDDTLTAGPGGGEMTGGAGADMLIANAGGVDRFIIEDASDSRLSFNAMNEEQGVDTIDNFAVGGSADKIVLPESLFDSLSGTVKTTVTARVATADFNFVFAAGTSLYDFVDGNEVGFFNSPGDPTSGLNPRPVQHSVAFAQDTTDGWLFIDVDGDGNLDIGDDGDLVIKLEGLTTAPTLANGANSDIISA